VGLASCKGKSWDVEEGCMGGGYDAAVGQPDVDALSGGMLVDTWTVTSQEVASVSSVSKPIGGRGVNIDSRIET